MVEQHLVEIRIRGDKAELLYLLVEDDPVCGRTEIDRTAKEFFQFGSLITAPMNEADGDRIEAAVRCCPAEPDKPRDQKFYLLPIGMSRNTSVAQGNREIAGLGAFQNHACI